MSKKKDAILGFVYGFMVLGGMTALVVYAMFIG